ncbi:WGR domain-containing protein [Kitasatospora sp. LaBMicrA B282]|uniref:WGR domain-containing protein n=1 Tax=Kitasatospora sp. LaBMicrA B282 TaxID=3420949 RepID=UPI003D097604
MTSGIDGRAAQPATQWRRFERSAGDWSEYREIRREGIRCFLRWSASRRVGKASTSTLDDEQRAARHAERKVSEWLRKGFVEVAPPPDAAATAAATAAEEPRTPVLDVLRAAASPHLPPPEYLPVEGHQEVYRHDQAPGHPRGFHEYLVLSDQGRRAVRFAVQAACFDPAAVAAFLDFLGAHREPAFDGRSHHKLPLPAPVGPFGHALLCSPGLARSHRAYPAIAARVATAFPVFDCEIGDADSEVLVDARIHGRGSLPYTDWSRRPQPVLDLRYDLRPSRYRRTATFKVFGPAVLADLLAELPGADPQSWLEVRSFRGEVRRLVPGASASPDEVNAFLLG